MAKQVINVGTAGDASTGDTLFDAFTKANGNFDELYPLLSRPVLIVARAAASGDGAFMTVGAAFTTIPLDVKTVDTANSYNTGSGIWVVPQTGLYLILGKVRMQDKTTRGANYGVGMDTSNRDSADFAWFTTSTAGYGREGAINTRIAMLNANDQLRLFAYADGATLGITAAALNVIRIL